MATSNQELIQKAITAADALASTGKLNPKQADKFIDFMVDETTWPQYARVVRFRNEKLEIDKLDVGKRVAMPKAEAKDPGIRRGVSTSQVVLQPSSIVVPFNMSDEFEDFNLEGRSVKEHIARLMATKLRNEIEELYLFGNKLGAAVKEGDIIGGGSSTNVVKDSFMALQDGWFTLADSANVFDAAGAAIGSSVWFGAKRKMPTKFRRRADLRWIVGSDVWDLWNERLSTRGTPAGDAALTGGPAPRVAGVQAIEAPLIPLNPEVTEHITSTGATATMSLKSQNIVSGSEIVTLTTLGNTPTAPLVKDTDYTIDYAAGTITNKVGGAWGDTADIKITYQAAPQMLLTFRNNLIVGIGRDIKIEKDRSIYQAVDRYAIHARIGVQMEETTACVKVKNIKETL